MSDSYLVTAGNKEGETTVTIAVTGTEITKSIKIVVSSEVKHNYVLTTELTDNEIFAGDGTTIASRLADNGQSVSGATFACEIGHSDILAIADNAITTVEAAVSADTTVTITVKASVDGEVVATKEITIVVKKTTYELTVNGNTTIEPEYGNVADLILKVDCYRLCSPFDGNYFVQMIVSKDKKQAYVCGVRIHGVPCDYDNFVALTGLSEGLTYRIEELYITASGKALTTIGVRLPRLPDFGAWTWHVFAVD